MLSARVLDLTRVLAGPLCSMMLGDLGADVIKVERLGVGDETRGWGPPFNDRGESAYYLSVNRNKKSIALDLRDSDDRDVLMGLIHGADVVIENFRPGSLERVGLGINPILVRYPELIWCTISGFGPSSSRPGYDFVIQAESGWMAITGPPDGPPMKTGVALADVIAGKDAAIAILSALLHRSVSGQGRHMTVSLVASAIAALVNVAQNVLVTGRDALRWGNAHPNLVPYQLFDSADVPIVVAVGNDAQWRAFAIALGLEELTSDGRFDRNAGRVEHRAELVAIIARRLRQRNAASWLGDLQAVGVPCGVVRGVLEALSEAGGSPLFGIPPSVPGTIRLPPPALDEHGEEIRRLGWGAFDALHR